MALAAGNGRFRAGRRRHWMGAGGQVQTVQVAAEISRERPFMGEIW
jgi:hypothetical protein